MNKKSLTFSTLTDVICRVDAELATQAARAVNISLTMRNWLIGYYIAEYELRGSDRALYGEGLLKKLSGKLQTGKVSACGKRQLYGYLRFYQVYPQIVRSVTAQLKPFLPDQLPSSKKTRSVTGDESGSNEIQYPAGTELENSPITQIWYPSGSELQNAFSPKIRADLDELEGML